MHTAHLLLVGVAVDVGRALGGRQLVDVAALVDSVHEVIIKFNHALFQIWAWWLRRSPFNIDCIKQIELELVFEIILLSR